MRPRGWHGQGYKPCISRNIIPALPEIGNIMLLHEVVDHSQFVVLDYNEYDEEIEVALPENVRVFTEISEKDLQEGMHNTYSLAC